MISRSSLDRATVIRMFISPCSGPTPNDNATLGILHEESVCIRLCLKDHLVTVICIDLPSDPDKTANSNDSTCFRVRHLGRGLMLTGISPRSS